MDTSILEKLRSTLNRSEECENEQMSFDWDDLGNEFRDRIYQYRDVPYLYPKFILRFLEKSGFSEWHLNKILCQLDEACQDFGFSIDDVVADMKRRSIKANLSLSNLLK